MELLHGGIMLKKQSDVYTAERALRCFAGLKRTDSCRESFLSLKVLTLFRIFARNNSVCKRNG
jgi:hypothetical protein